MTVLYYVLFGIDAVLAVGLVVNALLEMCSAAGLLQKYDNRCRGKAAEREKEKQSGEDFVLDEQDMEE